MVEGNTRTRGRTALYAVIALLALTAFSPGAAAASPDWPFPRGDLNNTGYFPLAGNFTEVINWWSLTGTNPVVGDIDDNGESEVVTNQNGYIIADHGKMGLRYGLMILEIFVSQ